MIVQILFNSFDSDARVMKELSTLATNFKEQVTLIACTSKTRPHVETLKENLRVHRISTFAERFLKIRKVGGLARIFEWMVRSLLEIRRLQPTIIHCHDLNTLHIGFFYKLIHKSVILIYDAHELETEQEPGFSIKKGISKILERIFYLRVDHLITVNDSIRENYNHMYGRLPSTVIYNSPPITEISIRSNHLRSSAVIPLNDEIYLYQGGFFIGRGLEIILEAFSELSPGKHVVFMGSGPLSSLVEVYSKKFPNIHLIPPVSYDDLPFVTSGATAGLLLYENVCRNNFLCSPNKLFEYINSEIPLICSPLKELTDIVNRSRVGILLKENSKEALKQAINDFALFHVDPEGFKTMKKEFSWERQSEKLVSLYKREIEEQI